MLKQSPEPHPYILDKSFFKKNTLQVAKELIGKVIYHKQQNIWLKMQIIETEAYLKTDKASHSSLGYSHSKRATFMPPGTIYMYYSRGKDSFNISTGEEGDAVLIKAGVPFIESPLDEAMIKLMQQQHSKDKTSLYLGSGQTILAKSLNLKVIEWNAKDFLETKLYIVDKEYIPNKIIQTKRLGIPKGRDENLFYRFIDYEYRCYCTKNPITKNTILGKDYKIIVSIK